MPTLEGLFRFADIDDVYDDRYNKCVVLSFSIRDTPARHAVEGKTLADALANAEVLVRRAVTVDRLRDEGLTDEDLDRLSEIELLDDAWQRGWMAHEQATELESDRVEIAEREPVLATAGEPVENLLTRHELVILQDLEREPDSAGIPVILQLPARIVLS